MKECLECESEKIVDGGTDRRAYMMLRADHYPTAKVGKKEWYLRLARGYV